MSGSMMKTLRGTLAMGAPGVLALVMSAAFWSRLPDPMPIHWDAAGVPNGFAPKLVGLLLIPLVTLAVGPVVRWAMRCGKADLGADFAAGVVGVFMLALHRMIIGASISADQALSITTLMALMGGLFVGLAAVMPHLEQNRRAGFRTPWSLGDETNWRLTHRFGAWTMGIGGALGAVLALVVPAPHVFWLAVIPMVLGSTIPLPFSYALHRVRR